MRELYTVVWYYIANYGIVEVYANNAENAKDLIVGGFSEDFKQRGQAYVFKGEASLKVNSRIFRC